MDWRASFRMPPRCARRLRRSAPIRSGCVRPLLLVLLGAVALVLLMACVNVGGLLVVRSIARQREIAIRFALGATRRRVMVELVDAESGARVRRCGGVGSSSRW